MKRIQVKDVYKVHGTATDILPEDSPLELVIERFAQEPGLRRVFLVDSRNVLSGVLTRTDILKAVHFKLYGGQGNVDMKLDELFKFIYAKSLKDLVEVKPENISVRENDNLQTALEKMMHYEEDLLPVVDSRGNIIGDLRLSEVLLKAIEDGKETGTDN